MNIHHDMTSHTLLTCESNEGAVKQVVIINYMWLICILASCLMFERSFDDFDSLKTLIIENQRLKQKPSFCKLHD